MVFRSELRSRRNALLRNAGEWTERITILLLLLFTVAGLCSVAVTGLAVARGQLRWPYSAMLFMMALLGLPLSIAWILMLCRQTQVWSRVHVARFAAVWYTLTLILFAASFNYWPLRLAFAVEQAPLEALARRVERGDALQMPLQVGIYTVTKVEKDSRGIVWLWICPHGDVTHQCSVFAHCTSAELPSDTVLFPRGLNAKVKLAHRWYCLGYEG